MNYQIVSKYITGDMITKFYKILDENNNTVYVGVTTRAINIRFKEHIISKGLNINKYSIIEFYRIEHPIFSSIEIYYNEKKKIVELERNFIKEEKFKGFHLLNLSSGGEWGSSILNKLRKLDFLAKYGSYDGYKDYIKKKMKIYRWLYHWYSHKSESKVKVWIRSWLLGRTLSKTKRWLQHWMYSKNHSKTKRWLQHWVHHRKSSSKIKGYLHKWIHKYSQNKVKKWLQHWVHHRSTPKINRWLQHWVDSRKMNKTKAWLKNWRVNKTREGELQND